MNDSEILVALPGRSQHAFEESDDAKARELFDPMPEGAKLCGSCSGYGSCGNKKYFRRGDEVVGVCVNRSKLD